MRPEPLRIGKLTIETPVLLAPMAGYTDAAMRSLCLGSHCGLVFTEVINAEGIRHGSHRTIHLLETWPGERPVAAHLYGASPDAMAEAAAFVERTGRFDLVDVNCGCPVRKIVVKGAGVALMKDPAKIGAIVRAMRGATVLPVTVKTRLGLSPERANVAEVAQAVEEAGGAGIVVHARYAVNRHAGQADWEALAAIKAARRIPVIGNGGVETAADALRMFEATGVDGVMIGKAAVGNPWIFQEAYCLLRGEPFAPPTRGSRQAMIVEHLQRLTALKEKERRYRHGGSLAAGCGAAMHFRGHLLKYLAGFRGWGDVRRTLGEMRSAEDVLAAVDRVLGGEQSSEQGA